MSHPVGRHLWAGMPGVASGRSRCLGAALTAYADRAMDPVTLLHWDRHVLTCACCRAAVAEERRVLAALRAPAEPTVPGDLRGMLLALAADPSMAGLRPGGPDHGSLEGEATSGRAAEGRAGRRDGFAPSIPVAPVRVVDRGTPAMHRSARRATVFAGLAAGATAAAAWGVAMTGAGAPLPSPATTTPGFVHGTSSSSSPFAPAAFMVANLGRPRNTGTPFVASSSTLRSTMAGSSVRPAVSGMPVRSAESTP